MALVKALWEIIDLLMIVMALFFLLMTFSSLVYFFLVEPNFDLKLIDTTLHCCKGMEGVKKTLCTNGQMAAFKSKRKQFFIKKRKLAFFY